MQIQIVNPEGVIIITCTKGPRMLLRKSIILSSLSPTKFIGEERNLVEASQTHPSGAPQCLQYAIFQE